MKWIAGVILVAALCGWVVPVRALAGGLTYDEISPPVSVKVTDVHDFTPRYAAFRAAIESGLGIPEDALIERINERGAHDARYAELAKLEPATFFGVAVGEPGAFLSKLADSYASLSAGAQAALRDVLPPAALRANGGDLRATLRAAAMFAAAHGTLQHVAFWNGMERVDDATGQTAKLIQPQQHRVVYLDVPAKRYRIAPYTDPLNPSGVVNGHVIITKTATAKVLGVEELGGVQVTGYELSIQGETVATGPCGTTHSFTERDVRYYSSFEQPIVSPPPGGCKENEHVQRAGSVVPDGKLILFDQSFSGFDATGVVVERGNVRVLKARDAGSFSIPANFAPW